MGVVFGVALLCSARPVAGICDAAAKLRGDNSKARAKRETIEAKIRCCTSKRCTWVILVVSPAVMRGVWRDGQEERRRMREKPICSAWACARRGPQRQKVWAIGAISHDGSARLSAAAAAAANTKERKGEMNPSAGCAAVTRDSRCCAAEHYVITLFDFVIEPFHRKTESSTTTCSHAAALLLRLLLHPHWSYLLS